MLRAAMSVLAVVSATTLVVALAAAPNRAEDQSNFSAAQVASDLLNDSTAANRREQLVRESVPHAAAVIQALTKDLPADRQEEYRRIPWIWRVAIEASRQNEDSVVQKLLEVSLPSERQPLDHWRAVVIGGGVVNGISQSGEWPAARITELLATAGSDFEKRWQQTVAQAVEMVDDESVPSGTRYDALRILGASTWKAHHSLIQKYLAKGIEEELQMGAVSAAGDLEEDAAAQALIDHLAGLTEQNRVIAVDALLRGVRHPHLLQKALENGKLQQDWLSAEQQQKLHSKTAQDPTDSGL